MYSIDSASYCIEMQLASHHPDHLLSKKESIGQLLKTMSNLVLAQVAHERCKMILIAIDPKKGGTDAL